MTGSTVATVTASDWTDWTHEDVAVVGDGIELRPAADSGTATGRFDAGTNGIQWDRVVFEITTPEPDTGVRVRYHASDETRPPDRTETWQLAEVSTPTDIRLSDAEGRYLHLRVELLGGTRMSPRIEAVDAYCPRESATRYLPEIYQDEAFLERFLAIFERSYDALELDLERVTTLLDPAGVPAESLGWLESWLAVESGLQWPESARRELLSRAPELYRQRGTRAGLESMVELYLDHVDEADSQLFCLEATDLDVISGSGALAAYETHVDGARSFTVFVGPLANETHREAVERIVTTESPAHTDGTVTELTASAELTGATFLGVNSRLTDRQLRLGGTALGTDATLTERTEDE